MSKFTVVVFGALSVAACSTQNASPTAPLSVPVFASVNQSPNANGGNFGTPLAAGEEVMPAGVVNTSNARGSAIFQLSEDGTELSYQLIVANIENVHMSHIHRGAPGTNGPVVVWLFPSTTPGAGPAGTGRIDGVIASGTITAANLQGVLAGQPLSALVADLSSGNAYVNVHTLDGVAPSNEGPGDYPGGEIRGKIEKRGK